MPSGLTAGWAFAISFVVSRVSTPLVEIDDVEPAASCFDLAELTTHAAAKAKAYDRSTLRRW